MTSKFIDTNIFIRFLTKDEPKKAEKCFQLFKKTKTKQIALTTTESVLSEVVYILSSKKLYNLSHSKIQNLLIPIINIQGFKIKFKKTFLQALDIYSKNKIDFEDALTVAHMQLNKIKEIYSYDKDFNKFSKIKRIEP
jgi:predicted nucleic acid-binding protein